MFFIYKPFHSKSLFYDMKNGMMMDFSSVYDRQSSCKSYFNAINLRKLKKDAKANSNDAEI